jgi:hypothetical protein
MDEVFPGKHRQTFIPLWQRSARIAFFPAEIGKLSRFCGKNRQFPTPPPARFGKPAHPCWQTSANPIIPTPLIR